VTDIKLAALRPRSGKKNCPPEQPTNQVGKNAGRAQTALESVLIYQLLYFARRPINISSPPHPGNMLRIAPQCERDTRRGHGYPKPTRSDLVAALSEPERVQITFRQDHFSRFRKLYRRFEVLARNRAMCLFLWPSHSCATGRQLQPRTYGVREGVNQMQAGSRIVGRPLFNACKNNPKIGRDRMFL